MRIVAFIKACFCMKVSFDEESTPLMENKIAGASVSAPVVDGRASSLSLGGRSSVDSETGRSSTDSLTSIIVLIGGVSPQEMKIYSGNEVREIASGDIAAAQGFLVEKGYIASNGWCLQAYDEKSNDRHPCFIANQDRYEKSVANG